MSRPGRGDHGPHRNPARFLAPVALIVVIVGTIVVVESGVRSSPRSTPSTRSTTLPPSASHSRRPARPPTYTVKPGDTLGVIAERTGVPEATIETLNPHLDPNSLHPGQRLRIRR